MGLQSAARIICVPLAPKFHTCSLYCIFCDVHAAAENDLNHFCACGRKTLRGFFDRLKWDAALYAASHSNLKACALSIVLHNILCVFKILITIYCYSYTSDLHSVDLGSYQLRPAMQLHFRWSAEPRPQDRIARLEALDEISPCACEPVCKA